MCWNKLVLTQDEMQAGPMDEPPSILWGLDPIFSAFARLYIKDILQMTESVQVPGKRLRLHCTAVSCVITFRLTAQLKNVWNKVRVFGPKALTTLVFWVFSDTFTLHQKCTNFSFKSPLLYCEHFYSCFMFELIPAASLNIILHNVSPN